MGVAKSDSLRCVAADQIVTENAERFAQIDLDVSDFEKERTQCECSLPNAESHNINKVTCPSCWPTNNDKMVKWLSMQR